MRTRVILLMGIIFLTHSLFSQETNYSNLSIEELTKLKEEAVASENFKEAAIIKEKINILKEIEIIDKEISEAVNHEDYVKASNLKTEKEQLLNKLNSKTKIKNTAIIKNTQLPANDGTLQLLFKNEHKNVNFFDVKINDKYVGSFKKGKDLLVSDVPTGIIKIELLPPPVFFSPKKWRNLYTDIEISEPGIYSLTINSFKDIEGYLETLKQNKQNPNDTAKLSDVFTVSKLQTVDKNSIYLLTKYNVNNFKELYPKKHSIYSTNRITFKLINFTYNDGFALNLSETGTDVIGNTDLIWGFVGDYNFYSYSIDNTSYPTFSIGVLPLFGYQFEPASFIILQTYISAGPNINFNTYPEYNSVLNRYVKENSTDFSFSAYWDFNAQFYFNKNFGLTSDIIGRFGNGLGITLGVTWRLTKEMHYRYIQCQ